MSDSNNNYTIPLTTVEECLAVIKKSCQIDPLDTSNDALLTMFLEESKALSIVATSTTTTTVDENNQTIETTTTSYTPVYRPFIVAAKFLKINPINDGIIESTGTDTVKFQNPNDRILGLVNFQRSLDKRLRKIPVGWTTQDFDKDLHTVGAFVV